MEVINWFTNTAWSQEIVLGSKAFKVNARYNPRDTSWYCDVIDGEDNILLLGRRLVLNTDILQGVSTENRPDGVLIVVPTVEGVLEVDRDNMGDSVQLIFVGRDEIL